MSSNNVQYITDQDFEKEVLNSDQPVLVDFYADWCGPCRSIAPFLEKVAGEKQGKVKIAKVNVDENQVSAARFQVRSIPTLILFKNGQPEETILGADVRRIQETLDQAA